VAEQALDNLAAQGSETGKLVSPARRRDAVRFLVTRQPGRSGPRFLIDVGRKEQLLGQLEKVESRRVLVAPEE
jgi:hypothetical protein